MRRITILMVLCLAGLLFEGVVVQSAAGDDRPRIDISEEYPRYWSYGGKPVLLLGGSAEDNLFQIDGLAEHLDQLSAAGGNFIRNTMSSRDEGDVWPFKQLDNGRYDLDRWNKTYWHRFEKLLRLTEQRGIIVQIELWDRFDFARDPWDRNPFNPVNNVTYTAEQSDLPTKVRSHPGKKENNFFRSVPALADNAVVLEYQQAYVDKLLSIALDYGNVLYCMDNETNESPAWGKHWSLRIRRRAQQEGVTVHTTEMWDPWDLSHPLHANTFEHPELYSFVDVSQNNHQSGQSHWDNAQSLRKRVTEPRRPMNNVKIYGADTGKYGSDRDGIERFWRNVIGGMASARFHRPDSGLGLGPKVRACLRSARMLTAELDVFRCDPGNALLSDREANEAYLTARRPNQYAVFFPKRGEVTLDLSGAEGALHLKWLNILESRWTSTRSIAAGGTVQLTTPGPGYWVALIVPRKANEDAAASDG